MKLDRVIDRARSLLARPDNDFAWSGWEDSAEAISELDRRYAALLADEREAQLQLRVLFAVTGPICETAVSSGWGKEYARLGNAFDAALRLWQLGRWIGK